MAGVLFVISIPTEAEELKLKNKPRKLQFHPELQYDQPVTPIFTIKGIETPKMKKTPSQERLISKKSTDLDCISVDIGESPGLARTNSDRNFLKPSTSPLLKRTKSTGQIDKSKLSAVEPGVLKKSWDGLKEIVSSTKKVNKCKSEEEDVSAFNVLDLAIDAPLELVMSEILKKMKIESAVWQMSKSENFYQITFSVEAESHEVALELLSRWGVGERDGSTLSMIPCPIYQKPNSDSVPDEELPPEEQLILKQKENTWNTFMNSVRARLNVAQIVRQVKAKATITFDFLTLLIVAGMLAAFGLVENSLVFLTSSMLISPLMGPIIAITFGIVIKDKELIRMGFVNEMFGILLATVIGFVFGLIVCSTDDRYGQGEGLTLEMTSRCEFHSLLVGTFTALPSGAAVAIAVLGGDVGSLVGVAISASLLPPAVNAGVLWALAVLYMLHKDDDSRYNTVIKTSIYSDYQPVELVVYGAISMLLTAVNIICILLVGVLVLKIKEVAPIVLKNQNQFWKHDIKVARDYNKTVCEEEDLLAQKIVDEIIESQPDEGDLLRNINKPLYQQTWSPSNANRSDQRDSKVADLEKIYRHMSLANPLETAMNLPFSHSKTVIRGISPPRYRSIIRDQIFPMNPGAAYRRASLPYLSTLGMPSTSTQAFGAFRAGQLDKITEMSVGPAENTQRTSLNAKGEGDDGKGKKTSRKFIVTPAVDP